MSGSSDKLRVRNAMDDPEHIALLQGIIARMRMAVAPMLDEVPSEEQFDLVQGMMISAGAMFAGYTVGHMLALGKLKPTDKGRATKVVTVTFRSAIKLGEHEARKAMLEQLPTEGRA